MENKKGNLKDGKGAEAPCLNFKCPLKSSCELYLEFEGMAVGRVYEGGENCSKYTPKKGNENEQ